MRDLMFPQDAERELDALYEGLIYYCNFVDLISLEKFVENEGKSISGFKFIFGDKKYCKQLVNEIDKLCSRFTLMSMVSLFEIFCRHLKIQEKVLREIIPTKSRMTVKRLIEIQKETEREINNGYFLPLESPSVYLNSKIIWMKGIKKLRNCIAHRLGIVDIKDIENTNSDNLKIIWLKPSIEIHGEKMDNFPFKVNGQFNPTLIFEEHERIWKMGEVVHIAPSDCHEIAFTIYEVAKHILKEFNIEIINFTKFP